MAWVAYKLSNHVKRTLVSRCDNISTVLVLLTSELLFDCLNHLGAMTTGTKDIEKVDGW